MKPAIQNVVGAVLTICAIAITGAVVHREFFSEGSGATEDVDAVRHVANWQAVLDGGHLIGAESASLRIVEFSDFECPFCRSTEAALARLRSKYGQHVAIIYRHLPVTSAHPEAFAAAEASECAADQGRFVEYHDALFANLDLIERRRWSAIAAIAGVPDSARFVVCINAGSNRSRVTRDAEAAQRIGVVGTPTFLFRDRMVAGEPGLEKIQLWLDSALTGHQ